MAAITTTQVSATMANGGEGEEDHEDKETNTIRERMNSTSSSTFTSSSSFRSTSTSSTTSSASSLFLLTNKPHKSHQAEWEAIRRLRSSSGHVSLQHFHLLRRLGSGDLGNVYLCRLRDHHLPSSSPHPLYAMKVVDRESLAARKKLHRAEIERQILSTLDHPFLPTLYASFDASHYSCLLMEFCPGGDLHVARQRQPSARFSLSSARFYAAEILVALEYLHMMGIVYRDLKPENVLVRGDGHIMLSDFDLSFKCDVVPKLLKLQERSDRKNTTTSSAAAAVPACSVTAPMSCFLGSGSRGGSCRIMRMRSTKTTTITTMANKENAVPSTGEEVVEEEEVSRGEGEVVAEPITARSRSFVGTHEYLAPEVISGLGHGSAVDWWTLGVFMYELLFGRTPFKGEGNEKTLVNILKQPLRFPRVAVASAGDVEEMLMAQDLISRLLVKNPKRRIGSMRGAVEIKKHGFFKGVNWALIRSVRPPEVPHTTAATAAAALQLQRRRYLNQGTTTVKGRRRPNSNYDNSTGGPRHFDFF